MQISYQMCSQCRAKSYNNTFNIIRYVKGKNTIITCVCDRCKLDISNKYKLV